MSNPSPYQAFFDKLDKTVESLADESADSDLQDAVDLLRRAGFVLGNLLNAQAALYPHLILDPGSDVVEGEAESAPSDASDPSLEQPQDA